MVTATYKRNLEKNGIEIRFSGKPEAKIRDDLLAKRWRYSGYGKFWYNFYSESNLAYAKKICGEKVQQKTERKENKGSSTRQQNSNVVSFSHPYRSPYKKDEFVPTQKRDSYGLTGEDYSRAAMRPLGVYVPISPRDPRYKRKRSMFS